MVEDDRSPYFLDKLARFVEQYKRCESYSILSSTLLCLCSARRVCASSTLNVALVPVLSLLKKSVNGLILDEDEDDDTVDETGSVEAGGNMTAIRPPKLGRAGISPHISGCVYGSS